MGFVLMTGFGSVTFAAASEVHPDALLIVDQHREAIVDRTVAAWPGGLSTERAEAVRQTLWGLRADRLLAANLSPGLDSLLSVLRGSDPVDATAGVSRAQPKALGDPLADLTYTPLTPCRIADTRGGGGALVANTTRTLVGYTTTSFSAQGGDASSCGIPSGVAALAMNVYAVNPTNLGFIKLWASNQTEPAVSTVNYEPPTVAIATGAIVPVDRSSNNGFKAKSPAQVHLIVDVVGYFRSVIAPGAGLRITRDALLDTVNTINGSSANNVAAGVHGATIAGGGIPAGDPNLTNEAPNEVTDDYGTVGGGYGNRAGDGAGTTDDRPFATVGGGMINTASGVTSTVAGGFNNTASGETSTIGGGLASRASGGFSTIVGGYNGDASGWGSTVAGGSQNRADGSYSFVAGHNAWAGESGCFVWSDNSSVLDRIYCGIQNAFFARAKGGFYLITGGSEISGYTGAHLAPGSTSWTTFSDRNGKENVADVDARVVLDKVVAMPVTTWNWKNQDATIRHIGPMAQDFHLAFGLGETEMGINTVDADGVALAAIQGLNAKLEAKLAERDRQISELQRAVEKLLARTQPAGM
jgi:hypothetical protein